MLSESLTAVVAGVIGYGLKAIYDRFFSERTVPVARLAERLNDGRPLHRHGLARITKMGKERLADWRAVLDEVRVVRNPTPSPAGPDALVMVRNAELGPDETHCPSPSEDASRTILFVRALEGPADAITAARALCEERAPNTEPLVRNYLKQAGHSLCVWICAPGLELRSLADLANTLQECQASLQPWVPVTQLVLETAVPTSIACQWIVQRQQSLVSGKGTGEPHAIVARGTRYQLLRDRFDALVDHGIVLGRVSLPDDLPIPDELLRHRINHKQWGQLTNCEEWSTALVIGPPGAGKTELCDLLLEDLVDRSAATAIVIGPESRRVRTAFELLSKAPIDGRDKHLIEFAESLSEIAPRGLIDDEQSVQAFGDSLRALINERRRPVVILVDDLHADKEMRAAVMQARERGDLRFLLVGRTAPTELAESAVLQVDLEPWGQHEAVALLTAWEYEGTPEDDLIAEPSVYFLRMIRRNAGLRGSDPAILLRGALANHLSSIEKGMPPLGTHGEDPARELATVIDMLQSGKPADDILAAVTRKTDAGVVDVLGLLAWVGRFNQEDLLLLVDDMIRWSDGLLTSSRDAETLLNLGREARIFGRGDATSSFWRNTFIADACAAVYCINRRRDWPEKTVAEMLLRFKSTGSLGILNLALETSERFVFIELLARARPDAIELVADLVSEDFAQRASGVEMAEHLAKRLILLASNSGLGPERIHSLSIAAARLARASEQARAELRAALPRMDNGGLLAIGVEALLLPPGPELFEELAVEGVDRGRVFFMASSLWSSGGLETLLEQSVLPASAEENALIRAGWTAWVEPREEDELDLLLRAIVAQRELGREAQELLAAALHEALVKVLASTSRHGELMPRWGRWIRELMAKGHAKLASIVAHSYAILVDRDLSRPLVRWIVSRDGSCAIPHESFEEASVGEILQTLELQPQVRLPSAKELQAVSLPEGGHELVRDRLPRNYVPGKTQILPVNLGTWDGSRLGHVSIPSETPRDHIGLVLAKKRVLWRPVIHIESSTDS